MKTLSEQIQELQAALSVTKDKLVEATKALGETADDANEGAVVELTAELEKSTARLESLLAAEKALGMRSEPAAPAVIKQQLNSKAADNLFGKIALVEYESRVKGMSKDQVIANRFKGDDAVVEVIKAAQNPANSGVTAYAGELTQIAYGTMLDELRKVSVLPRCVPAAKQHQFNGAASIKIPYRNDALVSAGGAFRAEGAAIRVGGMTFTSLSLTPKNLGVILTATQEMLSRSSIDLSSYFQQQIIADTSDVLDGIFLGASAGSAIVPPGIRNGVAGADTRAAAGTGTASDILVDVKKMAIALSDAKMGGAACRWIMSPSNWYAVLMSRTATGTMTFPEAANGQLAGWPVIVSQHMANTEVLLIDFEHVTFAMGAPAFLASEVATIHEEDTSPTAIGTAGSPNVVAAPVRSLFQTNAWALRMMLDADWARLRSTGSVQELSAVAWVG
jgi:HK97 family phage major capsid protein